MLAALEGKASSIPVGEYGIRAFSGMEEAESHSFLGSSAELVGKDGMKCNGTPAGTRMLDEVWGSGKCFSETLEIKAH